MKKVDDWDTGLMKDKFKKPKSSELEAFVNDLPPCPPDDEDNSDSDMPPSDSPPPTDSDLDSDDDDDDDDSDDSDSDDSSDDTSEDSSDDSENDSDGGSDDNEEAVDVERVELDMEIGGDGSARKGPIRRGKLKEKIERQQLDNSLKRDQHLGDLLEQICEYLEYGSAC